MPFITQTPLFNDIIVKYLKYPIASILIVGVKASDPKKLNIEQIKKNIFIPPPTVILNLVLLKIQPKNKMPFAKSTETGWARK